MSLPRRATLVREPDTTADQDSARERAEELGACRFHASFMKETRPKTGGNR
jgi:hypothetical protein